MSKLNNRYWLGTNYIFNNKNNKYFTIYPHHFIPLNILTSLIHKEINMHTGKRNHLQLPEDEQYTKLSTQLIPCNQVHAENKLVFRALNSSDNFAIIDYEGHINTKIDYFSTRVGCLIRHSSHYLRS